jgi:hypothetical protein
MVIILVKKKKKKCHGDNFYFYFYRREDKIIIIMLQFNRSGHINCLPLTNSLSIATELSPIDNRLAIVDRQNKNIVSTLVGSIKKKKVVKRQLIDLVK